VGSVNRVLWVLGGTSVADDRCPTQLVFILLSCRSYIMKTDFDFTPSSELLTFLKLNNLHTLAELLSIPDNELLKMRGFGYRILKEILQLRKI
jgi:DNA-directed RNA polymerase alpha subunit